MAVKLRNVNTQHAQVVVLPPERLPGLPEQNHNFKLYHSKNIARMPPTVTIQGKKILPILKATANTQVTKRYNSIFVHKAK